MAENNLKILRWSRTIVAAGLLAASSTAFAQTEGSDPPPLAPTIAEALEILDGAAAKDRDQAKTLTFEEFEAKVYREPFEGGKYIVNGDTPIVDRKHLQEFFENQVQKDPAQPPIELIVHQVGGLDAVWNSATKGRLTYCVSTNFGARYNSVVANMEAATDAWEAVADIDFMHLSAEDDRCTKTNQAVLFDVRPVNNGQYLARAFFPNEPRGARNVLIDESSFQLDPNDNLQLVGILRHELGHTLGYRHEHTRPSSGTCFEDSNWRPVTDYDPFSVMHYPQCNGLGDWTLTLTHHDKNGAACVYGPASGFTTDPAVCGDAGTVTQTQTFTQQSVKANEEKQYGPFKVAPGTPFEAKMQGSGTAGDPDLYVRFDAEPLRAMYDCRPFLVGADETCAINVPAGRSQAFVMIHGYTAGNYDLSVTHTSPAP